jgi:hypothetical protein
MTMTARQKLLLIKPETSYGVEVTPTAALNALQVFDVSITTPESDRAKRQAFLGWLGGQAELQSGFRVTLEFKVELAGSGTGGVAPAYGAALRACGWSETLLAAAVNGTAGTTTPNSREVIKLASSASAVSGAYTGMPIKITYESGAEHIGLISSYDGSTKQARLCDIAPYQLSGTTYSILPCAAYAPVDSGYESCTIYFHRNALKHKLTGARGTVSLSLTGKQIPTLTFKITGRYHPAVDDTLPTPTWYQQTPLMVCADNTQRVTLHSTAVEMLELTVEQGNAVQYRNPAGGANLILITDRDTTGSIKIETTSVASKNWEANVTGNVLDGLYVHHGLEAGNMIAVGCQQVQLKEPKPGEDDGIDTTQFALGFVPAGPGLDVLLSVF